MTPFHALLADGVILWISGFLIGIGLKTILDGFAKRDDFDRRLEGIETEAEDAHDDLEELYGMLDTVSKVVARHSEWIDAIEYDDEVDLDSPGELPPAPRGAVASESSPLAGPYTLSSDRPPANLPNLDYDYSQQFVSPPAHNE